MATAADQESTAFVGRFGGQSREMAAAMLDQSQDCVKILDLAGRIEFMNANGRCVMGIDDFGAIASKAWDELWPPQAGELIRNAVEGALQGRGDRFEAFCPTAKGTPKWWEVTVSPMVDSEGVPFAILATSRDVTERRQASESLETMAHEMRHRLRNAFAVSGAIALASAREDPGHREFAEALAQRYNSLSMVQSQLINQGDEQSLDALVTQLISAFDRDGGSFQVSAIPSVMLDEQQVRLVALVLGELSTNSLKHGALREGLPIRLSATRGDCTVILEWGEDLPNDPARDEETVKGSGSGHGLMQRMARAHGGGLEIEITADKLSARLEIRA